MGAVAGSIASQRNRLRTLRDGCGARQRGRRLSVLDRSSSSDQETLTVRVNFCPSLTPDDTSSMSVETEVPEDSLSISAAEDHANSSSSTAKSWRDEQSLFASESEGLGDSEKENTPFVRFSLAGRFVPEDDALPGYLSDSESESEPDTASTVAAESFSRTVSDGDEMLPRDSLRMLCEPDSYESFDNNRFAVHVCTETRKNDRSWMLSSGVAAEFTTGDVDGASSSAHVVHGVDLTCGESWQRQRVTAPEPSDSFSRRCAEWSLLDVPENGLKIEHHDRNSPGFATQREQARRICAPDCTIMLFDWDDTLLSSTWLSTLGFRVDDTESLPQELVANLDALEDLVIGILDDAQQYGRVCVITNAETGWVQLSAARFMPRVLQHLDSSDIRIISARSIYESDFPHSPSDWKTQAFRAELERHPNYPANLNLLVLGDSVSERDAAHAVRRYWLQDALVKTVKLVERPTLEQLRRELELVRKALPHICAFEGSFDVNLSVE
jgi:hypothetical protein